MLVERSQPRSLGITPVLFCFLKKILETKNTNANNVYNYDKLACPSEMAFQWKYPSGKALI